MGARFYLSSSCSKLQRDEVQNSFLQTWDLFQNLLWRKETLHLQAALEKSLKSVCCGWAMCQECKERWVASHGGKKGPMPVFPDCEDCKQAQVKRWGWQGLTPLKTGSVLWWWLMDDPKGRAGAGALPGLFANCERGGQGSNIFYTWYNTIDTIYRYIWIYIRCKKMRGRLSTRVASSCAPCSTSPAQEMSDHCKTCHEHIVGKYAPAIF